MELKTIPLEDIEGADYQVRELEDEEEFRELVESIRTHGLLQPLLVQELGEGKYKLVAGYRRLQAVSSLGWKEVPCHLVQGEKDEIAIQLEENIKRRNLTPIEEAKALFEIKKRNPAMSLETLSQVVGKSPTWVSRRMKLLQAPLEVQYALEAGRISAGAVVELMEIKDPIKRGEYLKIGCQRGIAADEARRWKEMANLSYDTEQAKEQATTSITSDEGKKKDLLMDVLTPKCFICSSSEGPLEPIWICSYCKHEMEKKS